MRLLLTADPFLTVPPVHYGGIERIIDSLVGELRRQGHAVGLVAKSESTCEVETLFRWPEAMPTAPNAPRFAVKLTAAARAFMPDVIHSFSRLLYLGPLLMNRRLPKIMSYQREPSSRTVSWARRIAGNSITFTGCSNSIATKGRRGGGRWYTVHNFVDLRRYTFSPTVTPDAPLVFLSRIEPIKGTHLAIEACRQAGRKLIIAGNHSDRDDKEGSYWREVVEPQIDGREIEYIGPVNDQQKSELLGKAAALVVPVQWEEPFGIVFIEALACGTPVISCPRGALSEIVRDGIDGFLAPDLAALERAARTVGMIDRFECRRRVEVCFSTDVVVEQYEKLYRDIQANAE